MNYSDTQLAMKFVATNLQELENGAQFRVWIKLLFFHLCLGPNELTRGRWKIVCVKI